MVMNGFNPTKRFPRWKPNSNTLILKSEILIALSK
jgi:hypothetical protein